MPPIPSGPPKDNPKEVEAQKKEAEREVLIRLTVLAPIQVFRFLCAIRRARTKLEIQGIIASIKKIPAPSISPEPAPELELEPDEDTSTRPEA